ncbi:hypothetical protein H0H93_016390 [Arthromyces matolae]|nr:hypothetical protein H0H93_016390 [Arthromyces matolae]
MSTALPSFLLAQLQALEDKGDKGGVTTDLIQAASTMLFVAGADTTSSSLAFFVLAMVLYPECQAKAQEEIEAVVGSKRLPEFQDRDNLPYLECLVQETLRSMEDDVYKGMLIPKGSVVIANVR